MLQYLKPGTVYGKAFLVGTAHGEHIRKTGRSKGDAALCGALHGRAWQRDLRPSEDPPVRQGGDGLRENPDPYAGGYEHPAEKERDESEGELKTKVF